jgi:hypothetical protein
MMISKITEAVIYESPDGGETIYVREPGSTQRQLHIQSPRAISLKEQLAEDKLWGEIRRAAKTNTALKHALDEAVLIYTLSK